MTSEQYAEWLRSLQPGDRVGNQPGFFDADRTVAIGTVERVTDDTIVVRVPESGVRFRRSRHTGRPGKNLGDPVLVPVTDDQQ